jgi:DNA polymerase-4
MVGTCGGSARPYTEDVKGKNALGRRILHVDLDPFLVSVERSLDPTLRGRPVVVGGGADGVGIVAAVSSEARALGLRPGQSVGAARRTCPQAAFRPGDLELYARFAGDVTSILQGVSRRVERPSADEAYVDLTPEAPGAPGAVAAAETIKDELQRRLGLDASLGLASSRLAARVASTCARPRGLLVVIPGYEASFLARQTLSFLPDLPPHLEAALCGADLLTLGDVAAASADALEALVGPLAAARLQSTARGEGEEPVAVTAPPAAIQEDSVIRDRRPDRASLETILDGLAERACARLRPFDLGAGAIALEVRRSEGTARRAETFDPVIADSETLRSVARGLALPLLDPAASVRGVQIRLGRLKRRVEQPRLFPERPPAARRG